MVLRKACVQEQRDVRGWSLVVFALVLWLPFATHAQTEDDEREEEETTESTSSTQTPGFEVYSIDVVQGDFFLASQFLDGISSSDDEHRINLAECKTYNGEEGLAAGKADDASAESESIHTSMDDADAGTQDVENEAVPSTVATPTVPVEPGAEPSVEVDEGTEVQSCSLSDEIPSIEISWRADSSASGLKWTAKIGTCSAMELTKEDTSCFLLTSTASEVSSGGNSFEVSLPYLLETLDIGADQDEMVRSCCDDVPGAADEILVWVYVGNDDDGAITPDPIRFRFDYQPPGQVNNVVVGDQRETLEVTWDAVDEDDVTYYVYYSTELFTDDDTDEVEFVSVDEGTTAELKGLTKNLEYTIRVGAVDLYGNVGALSSPSIGTAIETSDGWEHYRQSGGGEDGGHCFIATAAYGSYLDPHVQVLRHFRDRVLLPTPIGSQFVSFYYRNGASWAKAIESSSWARTLVRAGLLPLIALSWFLLELALPLQLLIILLGAGVLRQARRTIRNHFSPRAALLGHVELRRAAS